jgi:hypothetical protein
MAVVQAVLSWVVPLVIFRQRTASIPAPPPGQPLPPHVLGPLMPAVQTGFILAWALSESVSLFGFALAFMGFAPERVWPFFACGIGMTVIRFPTEGWVRAALGGPRAI